MDPLTQAILLLEQESVGTEDQQFVLEEVQRYLSNDPSRISSFDRMDPIMERFGRGCEDRGIARQGCPPQALTSTLSDLGLNSNNQGKYGNVTYSADTPPAR